MGMKRRNGIIAAALSGTLLIAAAAMAVDLPAKAGKYPQKWAHKYMSGRTFPLKGANAVSECGGAIYVGTAQGIATLKDGKWETLETSAVEVKSLACANGVLYAGGPSGLSEISGGAERQISKSATNALAAWKSGALAGSGSELLIVENGKATTVKGYSGGAINAIDAADGKAWIASAAGLTMYDGSAFKTYTKDNGLAGEARDVHADGAIVYVATGAGISKLDAKSGAWTTITGKNGGLPYEDAISIDGRGGYLWVGTTIGAARYDGSEWQYMQGPEYIADDRVGDVLAMDDGQAWLATPGGPTFIEYRMMTLREKADYFEKIVQERHNRYGQVSDSKLKDSDDLSTNYTYTRDNDGLWTSMYGAGECYRYAATGEQEALDYARRSLETMMFLQTVTETNGFIARSYSHPDDEYDSGEWQHITKDGKWRWKGDTSSDEVDGHYYFYSVYYDLCANDEEKKKIVEKVSMITDYIIDHDYFLVDLDGKPTTWGLWNPDYLNSKGRFQRNLNALEILSYLKTAYHITGNEKYQQHYMKLGKDENYFKYMVDAKLFQPGLINHSDDELAFLAYYPLLKYEKDERILKFYHKSLIRSWDIEKPERSPLFNFIYGAVMPKGTDFDIDGSMFTLKRISMDMVFRPHRNSHRADIVLDQKMGRHDEVQSVSPLPPDERRVMKWNGNPYALDSGGSVEEEVPTFWLLPYWMGRYYNFIAE